MNLAIRAICREGLAEGLGLAGVATTAAADAHAGAALLAEQIAQHAAALLLVEDAIFAAMPAATKARLARQPLPVVVVFPGPGRDLRRRGAEEEVLAILRHAVGYHVRMR